MIAAHPFFLAPAGNGVTDWVTPAGALATLYTGMGAVMTVAALSRRGRPVLYVLTSGSLPPGLTLNPDNGLISGVIPAGAVANASRFDFVILATDH